MATSSLLTVIDMKILEPGRPQEGWSREEICTGVGNGNGGCGAKLLVEQEDLYRTESGSAMDQSSESYTTFCCVSCGVETDMKDVPSQIARKRHGSKAAMTRAKNEKAQGPVVDRDRE
jgi:hypothetical protein